MKMWPEVERAFSEKRHELVLGGPDIKRRIDKNGLDDNVFKLVDLNYLDIHETSLGAVPEAVSQLVHLQSLVLHSNSLQEVTPHVAKLSKLKLLDVSRNKLTQLPEELSNLANIITFNFAHNELGAFPKLGACSKLAALDLSNNKLTEFPDVCHEQLTNLVELKLSDNEIEAVPSEIYKLSALKQLELGHNKITTVPGELADCSKLKVLDLQHNPISDRRLKKLIDQCRTKQVVDYIKAHCARQPREAQPGAEESESEEESVDYKFVITVRQPKSNMKIIVDDSLKNIRYHLLACVVHGIDFNTETFKKFIQVQNKLHDGVCCKRNASTIATHDFNKLPPGDLRYTTQTPEELHIHPLNRPKPMTGSELLSRLQTEANNLRKEKKRNTYSGIHKYLSLIEGRPRFPCLLDSQNAVISFPPITNSDVSKIDVGTRNILLEVTSSIDANQCAKAAQAVLKELVFLLGHDLEVTPIARVDGQGRGVHPLELPLVYEGDDIKVVKD